jgi:Cd2+/Zn2+-exporting ATPase
MMRTEAIMKSSIALVSAIAIVGTAQAGAEQAAHPEKQSIVTLKVSGMQCHLCAGTVERTAKELAGVLAAKADQPKGTAEIKYDAAKTSPEEIARLLTKRSGFKTEVPKAGK